MQARNRTWLLGSDPVERCRQRAMPIEGGDGSTLSLDFTTGVLDSRLTFSRASTATFINSSGYVEYAGANLFRSSNDLSGTNWTKNNLITPVAPSGIPAPSGSTTDITTVIPDTTNTADHRIIQPFVLSSGLPYTISFYVKPNGYNFFYLFDNAAASPYALTFNLTTNTSISFSGGSNLVIGTPDAAGWRKISFSFVQQTASTSNTFIIRVHPDSNFTSFAGNGTSGILVWGFQINPGSTVQTYYPTTTAAYHAPRFDYSPTNIGEPRGLLIEGQRVNKAINSETFPLPPYIPNDTTITVDSSDTNPSGTLGSRWFAPTTNGNNRFLGPSIAGFLTTTRVTYSIWLKAKGTNRGVFLIFNSTGLVNSSGVIISQPAGASASFTGNGTVGPTITNLSSTGWTRVAVTTDSNFVGTGNFDAFLYPDGTTDQLTTDSLYIWGAQAEQASLASSYIPTGASQVTREVDTAIIAAGTNFNSWYTGGTTGTFVSNWYGSASSTTARSVIATSDVDDQHLHLYQTASALTLRLADFGALATVTTANNLTANPLTKGAFSYAGTATSLCLNGETVATGTLGFSVAPTFLSIGGPSINGTSITDTSVMLNNSIRTLKYYPTRLTDARLKALTEPDYVAPTLDLNFLGGVLDSRLTFTSASTRTSVNTQGYVEIAAENLFRNSSLAAASGSPPTGWSLGGSAETYTTTGSKVLLIGTNGLSTYMYQSLGSGVTGMRYTIKFRVTNKIGAAFRLDELVGFPSNNATGDTFTVNGVSQLGSYTGWGAGSVIVYSAIPTGGLGAFPSIGVGIYNPVNAQVLLFITEPQLNLGSTPSVYKENTSTSVSLWNTPRFDNAVTTRTNFILQSNSFTVTPTWGQANGAHAATLQSGFESAPFGLSGTATRITSSNENAGIKQVLSLSNIAGKIIVVSFYAKSNKVGTQNFAVTLSSSITLTTEATTVWQRFGFVSVNPLTEVTLFGGFFSTDTLDLSIFGFQVEYVPTATVATDYIPTTTAISSVSTTQPSGLLIEAQAINLTTYNTNLANAIWLLDNGSSFNPVVSTVTDAPNPTGGLGVTQIVLNKTGGSYSRIRQTFTTATASTAYTMSVWMRTVSGTANVGIRLGLAAGDAGFNCFVTPTWTRFSYTQTVSTVDATPQIMLWDSITGNDETATVQVWGVQVEAGSGASSTILTGGSAGTRTFDHCYATGENFTSWFSVGAGTMIAVSDIIKSNIQNLNASISDDSTSNYVRMGFKVGGAANEYLLTTVGGAASFQGAADSGYAPTLNTVYKMGYAWDTNNFAIVANGGSVGTDTLGTLVSAGVLTKMVIGGDVVSSPNDIYFKNGHIRSLKYFPTRLTNTQLKSLTTG